MNNMAYIIFFIITTISNVTNYAMELNTQSFKNIKAIQSQCLIALKQLNEAIEIRNSKCWLGTVNFKALPIDYKIARCIEILCDAAVVTLGEEKAWHVESIGCGTNTITLPNGDKMGDGIAQTLDKYKSTKCHLCELRNEIKKTIKIITKDWKKSHITEYTDNEIKKIIQSTRNKSLAKKISKKSKNIWTFFVKPQKINEEDTLFRFFLDLLQFKDDCVTGHWEYLNNNNPFVYLWIKPNKIEAIFKALNLKLVSQ